MSVESDEGAVMTNPDGIRGFLTDTDHPSRQVNTVVLTVVERHIKAERVEVDPSVRDLATAHKSGVLAVTPAVRCYLG